MSPRTGVCEPLMPDVVASKAQSQLCELSGSTFEFNTQEFSMVGGYTEKLEKPQHCQNWGWVLARDNTVHVETGNGNEMVTESEDWKLEMEPETEMEMHVLDVVVLYSKICRFVVFVSRHLSPCTCRF